MLMMTAMSLMWQEVKTLSSTNKHLSQSVTWSVCQSAGWSADRWTCLFACRWESSMKDDKWQLHIGSCDWQHGHARVWRDWQAWTRPRVAWLTVMWQVAENGGARAAERVDVGACCSTVWWSAREHHNSAADCCYSCCYHDDKPVITSQQGVTSPVYTESTRR